MYREETVIYEQTIATALIKLLLMNFDPMNILEIDQDRTALI